MQSTTRKSKEITDLMAYPLRFEPVFQQYLWGGRRLATMLNKSLGDEGVVAESWEVVDHEAAQSIVAFGPLQGTSLNEILQRDSKMVLGRHTNFERFPLLFKFLDCHRVLSVQVHPDDQRAQQVDPPDFGKTEAWVILHADPGSVIYAGLHDGIQRRELAQALSSGNVEECLHSVSPQAGDCLFIPAGLVHALGAGLVVAEIQQSSNLTYRLFDWNRLDADGRPRPLHIDQALACIDFDLGPAQLQQVKPTDAPFRKRLVECDKFVLDRLHVQASITVGGDDRFHLLAMLSGNLQVESDPSEQPFDTGKTMLLPAGIGATTLEPTEDSMLLDIYLP